MRHFFVFFLAITCSWIHADEVENLRVQFDQEWENLARPLEGLKAKYRDYLTTQKNTFQQSGNLKAMLAVDEELKNFETAQDPELSPIPELQRLQAIYRQQKNSLEQKQNELKAKVISSFKQRAEQLSTNLTKEGKIELAKKALSEAERYAGLLNENLSTAETETTAEPAAFFNGTDFTGWIPADGGEVFSIKNEVITATITESSNPRTMSFLYTEKSYSDFELEFEVKCDENLNSGVQIRTKTNGTGMKKVNGPQVEIDPGDGRTSISGYLYGQGMGGWLTPDSERQPHRHFKSSSWNKYKVTAKGPKIEIWLNDEKITTFDDPKIYESHPEGSIALQVIGAKTDRKLEVQWRNLSIREL